jgi:hypothetical protein
MLFLSRKIGEAIIIDSHIRIVTTSTKATKSAWASALRPRSESTAARSISDVRGSPKFHVPAGELDERGKRRQPCAQYSNTPIVQRAAIDTISASWAMI